MAVLLDRIRNSVAASKAAEVPAPQAPAALQDPAAPAEGLANRLGRAVFHNPVANGVGGMAAGVRGKAGEIRERAGQAVDNVADRVRGAVDAAKQKKDQFVDEAKGEAEGMAQRVKFRRQAVIHRVRVRKQAVFEGAEGAFKGVFRQGGLSVFRQREEESDGGGDGVIPASVPAIANLPVIDLAVPAPAPAVLKFPILDYRDEDWYLTIPAFVPAIASLPVIDLVVPAPAPAIVIPPVLDDGGSPDIDHFLVSPPMTYQFQSRKRVEKADVSDLKLGHQLQLYMREIRSNVSFFAELAYSGQLLEQEEFVALFMQKAHFALRMTIREEDMAFTVEWSKRRMRAIEKALAGFFFSNSKVLNQFFLAEMMGGLFATERDRLINLATLFPAIRVSVRYARETFIRFQAMASSPPVDRLNLMNALVEQYVPQDRLEEIDELFDWMEDELGEEEVEEKLGKALELYNEGCVKRER